MVYSHRTRKYIKTNDNSKCRADESFLSPSQCSLTKLALLNETASESCLSQSSSSKLSTKTTTLSEVKDNSESVSADQSSLENTNPIGLARIQDGEMIMKVALRSGAILGRPSKKRALSRIEDPSLPSNKICIGISWTVTGVSREQVRILKIMENKVEIEVCAGAKNPVKINCRNEKFILHVGKRVVLSIGDMIIFDAYEKNPLYVYNVVGVKSNCDLIVNANKHKLIRRATVRQPLQDSTIRVDNAPKDVTVNINKRNEPSSLEAICGTSNERDKNNHRNRLNTYIAAASEMHEKENTPDMAVNFTNLSSSKLHQWSERDRREALICYYLTKLLNIPCKMSAIYWNERNPTINASPHTINFQARSYIKKISSRQLVLIKKEVTHLISKTNSDNNTVGTNEAQDKRPRVDANKSPRVNANKSPRANVNKSHEKKSPRANVDRAQRIKVGTQFRVDFEEEDLFGLKRKQWFFGYAKNLLKTREDVSQSSNLYKYEIDLVFRDSSVAKVIYPSPGVQQLRFDPKNTDKIIALTSDGVEFAYDKNPNNIRLGDVVDCRLELNNSFSRGRVAELSEDGKTCCVLFANDKYESEILLDRKFIACVERGSQEIGWLLGLNIIEDDSQGRIKEINSSEYGHVLSFDVQFGSKTVVRTYAEIMSSLFSPLLSPYRQKELESQKPPLETQLTSLELHNTLEIQNAPTPNLSETVGDNEIEPPTPVRSTTLIHTSLSNTLWRAFHSNPHTGFEMISHFIQAHNVANKSLIKKLSSIFIEGPKEGISDWNSAILAEFSLRCCNYRTSDLTKHLEWVLFEKHILKCTELISFESSSVLNLTRVTFSLECLHHILGQMLENDQFYSSFFGPKGSAYKALKHLSYCAALYWSNYSSVLLHEDAPSNNPNLAIRVRRCVEAFGSACSKLASIYCITEGLKIGEKDCALVIKDSFVDQLRNYKLNSRRSKQLKLLFVLSLEDENSFLQKHLCQMLNVSSDFSVFEL